ncbi:MAG: hypothetical protein NC110_06900 [Ruminococcus sp.]|nr:hypothetical protein [Ruminococcus sp.]
MKIAYRIVTPILALAAIAGGIFLKMFYFVIGSTDEQIGSLVNAVSGLITQNGGKNYLHYEFSVFELLKTIAGAKPSEDAGSFAEIAKPIMPQLISFIVVFVLVICVLVAIAVVSAALSDSKKKRQTVIGLCAGGLVLMFICIIISNSAFAKLTGGEISLTDLMTLFSDNALMTLATAILSVTSATLSAGFYAVFGCFMVIIIWTIVTNMIIKTPIQINKTYRRKKPMKKISAVFHK